MSARRTFFFLALLSLCLALAACSNSNSTPRVVATTPIFTSSPVTAAAQGAAYSYSVAATDPSGGTITYALTTGPTGATLSGNTVNWTPAASQSRTSSNFTVTATTSEGGTATQSWTVSPTGIITVNEILTYWTPTGQQQVPAPPAVSNSVAAVVPQADGSLLVLKGSSTGAGVISIPGVPAGNYWLTLGPANPLLPPAAAAAYWTSASTFDAGRDYIGTPISTLPAPVTIQFDFNLSGLDSVNAPTPVLFDPEAETLAPEFVDSANSTTLTASIGYNSNLDWTRITTAFLLQYDPATLGPLNNMVLGASAPLSVSLTNGTTNTITQTLQPSSGASLNITVPGSQWAPMLQGAGLAPVAPSGYASGFSLVAEPFVTGINATGLVTGSDLVMVGTAPQSSGFGFTIYPFGGCDATGFPPGRSGYPGPHPG